MGDFTPYSVCGDGDLLTLALLHAATYVDEWGM